jgi:hypothetical protein
MITAAYALRRRLRRFRKLSPRNRNQGVQHLPDSHTPLTLI